MPSSPRSHLPLQTGVQRVAVATAANMCRGLSSEHAEAAQAAAPILINLLQYQVGGLRRLGERLPATAMLCCADPQLDSALEAGAAGLPARLGARAPPHATSPAPRCHLQDAKIVDSACLALTRIAEAFARQPAHLEALCGLGLITSIVQMVGVSEAGSMTSQLQVRRGAVLRWLWLCMQDPARLVLSQLLLAHALLNCPSPTPPNPPAPTPTPQVSTFYGLLKILATMARGSHVVAEALMQVPTAWGLGGLRAL